MESSSEIHSFHRFEVSLTQEWNCYVGQTSACNKSPHDSWLQKKWRSPTLGGPCHLLSFLHCLKLAPLCYLYFFLHLRSIDGFQQAFLSMDKMLIAKEQAGTPVTFLDENTLAVSLPECHTYFPWGALLWVMKFSIICPRSQAEKKICWISKKSLWGMILND